MKQKDIHIVFGEVGKGTFVHSKEFDLDDIRLICLEDCLNLGPICGLYSSEIIEKRKAWLLKAFDSYLPVDKDIELIKTIIEHPEKNDKIFLWTGYCISEILSTARLLYHLPKLNKNIFITDFPNIPVKNANGNIVYPIALAQTALSQVNGIAKHFKQLTDEELTSWRKLWGKIKLGNSMLRVFDKSGTILEKQETYFDAFLESYCTNEFQRPAKIIGQVLVDIDFCVGDSYLNWRLKQLSLMNKMEARGSLDKMRDYEVKLLHTTSGLQSGG
jgi:hypothetical protein